MSNQAQINIQEYNTNKGTKVLVEITYEAGSMGDKFFDSIEQATAYLKQEFGPDFNPNIDYVK